MKAVTFPEVNRNWAESQDEYNTLPAAVYQQEGQPEVS